DRYAAFFLGKCRGGDAMRAVALPLAADRRREIERRGVWRSGELQARRERAAALGGFFGARVVHEHDDVAGIDGALHGRARLDVPRIRALVGFHAEGVLAGDALHLEIFRLRLVGLYVPGAVRFVVDRLGPDIDFIAGQAGSERAV